jgi:hypothetical protein
MAIQRIGYANYAYRGRRHLDDVAKGLLSPVKVFRSYKVHTIFGIQCKRSLGLFARLATNTVGNGFLMSLSCVFLSANGKSYHL